MAKPKDACDRQRAFFASMFGGCFKILACFVAVGFGSLQAQPKDPFFVDPQAIEQLRKENQAHRARAQALLVTADPLGYAPTPTGFKVPYFQVGKYVSTPNQELSDWLWSLAPVLQSMTKQMHWEVCGRIYVSQSQPTQYALLLSTSRSALFCAFSDVSAYLPGFTPSHETIHTHPSGSMEVVSELDKRVSGLTEEAVFVEPEDFSSEDIEAGDGWLVTPQSRLLHLSKDSVHEHQTRHSVCPMWTGKLKFRSRFMLDTTQKEDTTE